ncbi:hypothetical protein F2Q70_00033621 [Brassica cretica]|uniref:Uncharacterized protein n=1 Tax=Brassica cretica TaxID=69181 RepID=A0A8S9FJI1_BRACR|nr:hypothetical protein F2Q70_00033621 [Brassica cretica]
MAHCLIDLFLSRRAHYVLKLWRLHASNQLPGLALEEFRNRRLAGAEGRPVDRSRRGNPGIDRQNLLRTRGLF